MTADGHKRELLVRLFHSLRLVLDQRIYSFCWNSSKRIGDIYVIANILIWYKLENNTMKQQDVTTIIQYKHGGRKGKTLGNLSPWNYKDLLYKHDQCLKYNFPCHCQTTTLFKNFTLLYVYSHMILKSWYYNKLQQIKKPRSFVVHGHLTCTWTVQAWVLAPAPLTVDTLLIQWCK